MIIGMNDKTVISTQSIIQLWGNSKLYFMLKFKEKEDKSMRYDIAEERWMPLEVRS